MIMSRFTMISILLPPMFSICVDILMVYVPFKFLYNTEQLKEKKILRLTSSVLENNPD